MIRYNFFYPSHEQVVSKGYLFYFSSKVFLTGMHVGHSHTAMVWEWFHLRPSVGTRLQGTMRLTCLFACTMWCHFITVTQHIKTAMLNSRTVKVCPKDRYIQEHNF